MLFCHLTRVQECSAALVVTQSAQSLLDFLYPFLWLFQWLCSKCNGYSFDVFCILHLLGVFSGHVYSHGQHFHWGMLFCYTSASIIRVDTACVFGPTKRDETKEERKTEWSQIEEYSKKTQALPSSDYYRKCTVFSSPKVSNKQTKTNKSGGYCNMKWRYDVLHTCTMILSEHFQAHRHLCADLLRL